jgi:hypothetical protein
MPFEKDYNDQAKVVKYLLTANKELAKLQKEMTDGDKVQAQLIKQKQAEVTKLNKVWKDNAKAIKAAVSDYEDMDDTMVSIGNTLKQNNKFVNQQSIAFEGVKIATTSIAMQLANGAAANKKTQSQVEAASNAYKNMHTSIAATNQEFALGKISNQERIEQIKQQSEAFKDVVSVIDMTNIKSEDLVLSLTKMSKEAESFSEEMKHAQMNSERLDGVFDNFSGIPALGEVNTLLKTNIKDTIAFKAAVFALGAALGKAAFDYFGAPIKSAMQQHKEVAQAGIDGEAERAKIAMDKGFIDRDAAKGYSKIQEESDNNRIETAHNVAQAMNEAAFAGQRAANAFSASMKSGAAEFNRAAKTALFGKSIGGIGYGAAQMQLAGIGADKIASAMEAAGAATGKMPTAKAAADMAVMAERTGQSVDDIAGINEAFQRMDGMSAEVAMNMQEGMRNMADQAGIGLGNLMKEVAEASKEALGYQIKSGPALAKAVAYTQSMGLNFGDVAKAGKNMVMNYKDSIKAEMQLSSLLGEQVDLSEVRAKFAAGDTEGALSSLKSQGLDPADMDMFQQQALQDALGGMDLSSLSKVATNTGKSGGNLAAGNAKGGNQEFLTRTQQAEASLSAQQASISANEAVVDAKLSGQIADTFINSQGHKDYLKAQADQATKSSLLSQEMEQLWKNSKAYNDQLTKTAQLNFVDTIKEGLMSGLAAVGGGLLSTLASKLIPGGGKGGGLAGMLGGGGGGAAAASPVQSAVGGIQSATSSVGSTGGGIGATLTSMAGGLTALTPLIPTMLALAAAILLITPALFALAPIAIKIAEVIGNVLVKALEMAGPIITSIFKGIGSVIESIGKAISGVITSIADSISKLGGLNPVQLLAVAGGIAALAGAIAIFGGASAVGGFLSGIGSFFGGDPVEKFQKFEAMNAAQLMAVADSMKYLAASISSFVIAPEIAESVVALGKGFDEFADYLNDGEIDTINAFSSALGGLNMQLMQTAAISGLMGTAAAAFTNLAGALGSLAGVNIKAINDLPWVRMIAFAGAGGRITLATSANNNFNIAQDSAKNIEKLATDSKANLQISKNLQALLGVLADSKDAAFQLSIDGSAVTRMIQKREENRKATKVD